MTLWGSFASFRAKVQLAEDVARRIRRATSCLHRAGQAVDAELDPLTAMHAALDATELQADRRTLCGHTQSLARSTGSRFREEIERNITEVNQKAPPAMSRVHIRAHPRLLFIRRLGLQPTWKSSLAIAR